MSTLLPRAGVDGLLVYGRLMHDEATALKIAVLVSGRGSNLVALMDEIAAGCCRVQIVAVISDRASCPALDRAREAGVPVFSIRPKHYADRAAWDQALAAQVAETGARWVVLAGFMRIVGPAMLERFGGAILNVHPSLLPAFPGMHAAAQAIAAGVEKTGCTVHLVDAGVDTGPILAQAPVAIGPGEEAAVLQARIQVLEHRLLPAVLDSIAQNVC